MPLGKSGVFLTFDSKQHCLVVAPAWPFTREHALSLLEARPDLLPPWVTHEEPQNFAPAGALCDGALHERPGAGTSMGQAAAMKSKEKVMLRREGGAGFNPRPKRATLKNMHIF